MDIKCLFLGYCKETKSYRLTCLQTKNIIENKDVVFMEDNISIRNDLEMHPNKKKWRLCGGRCEQTFQIIFM